MRHSIVVILFLVAGFASNALAQSRQYVEEGQISFQVAGESNSENGRFAYRMIAVGSLDIPFLVLGRERLFSPWNPTVIFMRVMMGTAGTTTTPMIDALGNQSRRWDSIGGIAFGTKKMITRFPSFVSVESALGFHMLPIQTDEVEVSPFVEFSATRHGTHGLADGLAGSIGFQFGSGLKSGMFIRVVSRITLFSIY